MIDLDDSSIYDALDPSRLRLRLRSMAEQCRQGWESVPFPNLPDHYGEVDRIVHFGMGGSAIAADYLQTVVTEAQGPPVEVYRGFRYPGPIDDKTLTHLFELLRQHGGDPFGIRPGTARLQGSGHRRRQAGRDCDGIRNSRLRHKHSI